MKLTVLVDNHTSIDHYYLGEPGLCYYIEDEDSRFLLDTGYSDIYIENARRLGIDLSNLDTIVLSHGHNDHTGGLPAYFEHFHNPGLKIIAHPGALSEKQFDGENIGITLSEMTLIENSQLILTKAPYKVSPNFTFLGEIPQLTDFEPRKAIGTTSGGGCGDASDFLFDDSALVYTTPEGIYIVTGCSHSGICNIVEHAKSVTGDSRVLGIIGGFHLFKLGEQVDRTIQYFKDNHIESLLPCHCTSFRVRAAIHQAVPLKREVGVGLTLEW